MNKLTNILVIMSVLLSSCNSQNKKIAANTKLDTFKNEKIILYHADSSVHNDRQLLYLQNLEKLMGLPLMSNGIEGIYVRIWIWDSQKNYVIDISKNGLSKECNIIAFSGKKIDSSEYIILHKNWKDLRPKSGWESFFEKLKEYQIPTMKGGKPFEEIEETVTFMSYIQFEIAQPGQCRFYEYLEPSFYRYVDSGSKNVYEFLEYFNSEMNVQVYNPAKNSFVKPK